MIPEFLLVKTDRNQHHFHTRWAPTGRISSQKSWTSEPTQLPQRQAMMTLPIQLLLLVKDHT